MLGNAELAAGLRQLAEKLAQDDPRRLAAHSAARNIADHPIAIRTDKDARAVPRVGPAILKMLKLLGVRNSQDGDDQLYIQGAETILKKRRMEENATAMQPSHVLNANWRIAKHLREIAQCRSDHTRFSLNRAAAAVETWPAELKTFPQLVAVPHVQLYTAHLIIESMFKRTLTREEQAFADGAANQSARLQQGRRQPSQG